MWNETLGYRVDDGPVERFITGLYYVDEMKLATMCETVSKEARHQAPENKNS